MVNVYSPVALLVMNCELGLTVKLRAGGRAARNTIRPEPAPPRPDGTALWTDGVA